LAFHLQDSASFQAFARLGTGQAPSKATLQANISAITESSWAAINAQLMAAACDAGAERGVLWRLDSTAIAAPIHEPTDSSLLLDGIKTIDRLLKQAEQLPGAPVLDWRNHTRRAKRRDRAIAHTRGMDKKKALYRDLIEVTEATIGYVKDSVLRLALAPSDSWQHRAWQAEVAAFIRMVEQVDPTRRRVFDGEQVPASDKIVSLFEPHTDIIVKDKRGTTFGHKLNLARGQSGLIFDVVVEDGHPADSERFMPMLGRHITQFGRVPRQTAVDGGYVSQANLTAAKKPVSKTWRFTKSAG
jgi:IS5 family transposase